VLHRNINGKQSDIDLKRAPMVLAEINKIYGGVIPKKGPVIVSEWNNLPWPGAQFRKTWRRAADAVGVPKHVKNMDASKGNPRKPRPPLEAPKVENELAGDDDQLFLH